MIVAVVARDRRQVTRPAGGSGRLDLGILGELQALNGGLALLGNVPNNVRDGVRLIFKVTVGYVAEASGRNALACSVRVFQQAVFQIKYVSNLKRPCSLISLLTVVRLHIVVLLKAFLDLAGQVVARCQRLDQMLHMVRLTTD